MVAEVRLRNTIAKKLTLPLSDQAMASPSAAAAGKINVRKRGTSPRATTPATRPAARTANAQRATLSPPLESVEDVNIVPLPKVRLMGIPTNDMPSDLTVQFVHAEIGGLKEICRKASNSSTR